MAKGIILEPQSSDPIPADKHGFFVDSGGDFIHSKDDGTTTINITQVAAAAAPNKLIAYVTNNTGSLFPKGKPASMNSSGELQTANVSNDTSLQVFGLAYTDINNGVSGQIVTHGRVEDVTLTAAFGDILYIKPDGTLIGTSEFTSGGVPTVNNDGYVAGDNIVRVGIVAKNLANPVKKDIIVNVQVLSQI